MKHFPSYRYHEKHGEIIIKNQEQHDKLEAEGWHESPADFESNKNVTKEESEKERLVRELAEIEDTPGVTSEASEEGQGGEKVSLTEPQIFAALISKGFTKKDLKGKALSALEGISQGELDELSVDDVKGLIA